MNVLPAAAVELVMVEEAAMPMALHGTM